VETIQQIVDRAEVFFLIARRMHKKCETGALQIVCKVKLSNRQSQWQGDLNAIDASFSTSLNIIKIGLCIRDSERNFVIAKTTWITSIIDVDMGEALGLLSAL